jgi:N-acetylglucosamine-6-sulfatase
MRRRVPAGLAAAALVVGLLGFAGPPAFPRATPSSRAAVPETVAAERRTERPNIVVIMADDMRAADLRHLPATRRLMRGVDFPEMISQHPLCCPARAQFLTGQLAQNNGVRANPGRRWGGYAALRTKETLPVWLQEAGYRTAFWGKHLNGYDWRRHGRDPGWDVYAPLTDSVYGYYGWSIVEGRRAVRYDRPYVTDFLASRASQWVRRQAGGRAPFFVFLSHVAPHSTQVPGKGWKTPVSSRKYARSFRDVRLDTADKPSFNEPDVSDKPRVVRHEGLRDLRRMTEFHRGRVRTLASLDDANARLLRTLERSGELDDTLVLFTSDNGFLLGEHRLDSKILGYEESLRVPLLARGPGIPPRTTSASDATILDLPATIVDAAGARAGIRLDGESLLPVMQDPSTTRRTGDTQLILGGARNRREQGWGWLFRGVRTERYTLMRYGNGALELYDRREDPFQMENVARSRAYVTVREELLRRLDALASCAGESCSPTFGPVPEPLSP